MNQKKEVGKTILSVVCLFIMFFNRMFPPLFGLNQVGTSIICVFGATVVLLLFVNGIWPATAAVLGFAVSGVGTFSSVLASSFGNNITWLVAFAGMVISVLDENGVIRRIAIWFVSRPFAKKNPWMFVFMLLLATLLIGSISDPTALMIIMSVLVEQITLAAGEKKGSRLGSLLTMAVLFIDAVSTGITPIGHPIPVLIMDMFADIQNLNFLSFSLGGFLVSIFCLVIIMVALKYVFKLDVEPLRNVDADAMYRELGPMTVRAKIVAAMYGVVIAIWLLPTLLQNVMPEASTFVSGLGTTAPLVVAFVLMCVIKVDGRPLMDVNKAVASGCPWGACFTVAIALYMGGAVNNGDGGIVTALTAAGQGLGSMSAPVYVLFACLFCCIMTNFTSNTVTATLVGVVSYALMTSGVITGVNPAAFIIIMCIVDACALAAAPGSAFAAIVAGKGWVSSTDQFKIGFGIVLVNTIVLATAGYGLLSLIF